MFDGRIAFAGEIVERGGHIFSSHTAKPGDSSNSTRLGLSRLDLIEVHRSEICHSCPRGSSGQTRETIPAGCRSADPY